MPRICTGVMRKALLVFGLTVAMAAPACAVAGEGKFPDLLGLKGQSAGSESAAEWSASLTPAGRAGEFVLQISVKLPPEHHIYSMTKGEGEETKIEIKHAEGLEPIGNAFVPDHNPKLVFDTDLSRDVEKYLDHVAWTKHFRLKSGAAAGTVAIAGLVQYQICNPDTCKQEKFPIAVKLAAAPPLVEEVASESDNLDRGGMQKQFKQLHKGNLAGTWTVDIAPRQVRAGDEVTITVRAELNPGWHVYPLDLKISPDGGSLPTVIGLTELGGLLPQNNEFIGPAPLEKPSEDSPGQIDRYHEGRIEWTRKFKIPEGTIEGDIPLAGKIAWTMCNSRFCLPPTGFEFAGKVPVADELIAGTLPLTITANLSQTQASEVIDDLGQHVPDAKGEVAAGNRNPGSTTEIAPVAKIASGDQGLFAFLFVAVLAGFAALLTPCVFPMIPITVSFFQKQSEKQHHRPVTMASVYCLGIIGTFTGLGMLMSIFFGADSLSRLANNFWLNLFIGGVLIFFALNLLGMFEIRVPSWLLTYTAGKESRGGFIGVLFMALTFTLTSFTCTFAFAGLLLAAATKGDRLWPILGLLAFSAAFSVPFFFLALFPSLLQKLPKSGGWMNVVKVIMGLIEIGASFMYFGTADQTWNGDAAIFDFHLMISAWAVISVACALYLLGLFRLPHDTPADHIGVFRFVSAMSFMGLAAYLAVGLFGAQKPQGVVWKYIAAFANPDFQGGADRMGPFLEHGPLKLKYALDFERAFDFAIEENKPVFLDFTGVSCKNCRFMEQGPMSQPEIEERLKQFVRIQLFTDSIPKMADREEAARLKEFNIKFQGEWYGDISLPSYVVIPPDRSVLKDRSKILSNHSGKTDESTFAQFLDRGLAGWRKVQAQKNAPVVSKR